MKKISLFLSLLAALCLVFAFAGNQEPTFVPDEIIVKFAQSVSSAEKEQINGKYGLLMKKESFKKGAFVVYKHQDPMVILGRLKGEPGVIYAEQNAYAYACMIPNDPLYHYQWNMTRIGMEQAWDVVNGSGAVAAILDTGVLQSLQDLAQTDFMPGWDFVNDDNDPTDDNGHGSFLCGTIAQSTNNFIGCAGIAYGCTVMPVKVLNHFGAGTYADVADGIYYAADNGAHVINMSLGGSTSSTVLEDAVNYAWANDVVLVCAAGAGSTSMPMYPAAYENCMAVSATNYLDEHTGYSNYGPWIDIAAPGGDSNDYDGDGLPEAILQNTFNQSGEGYYYYSGTSPAAAHVTGAAALVKSCDSTLTNAEIRNILESTALDLGDPGWDPYYGHGRLDAYAAVGAACGVPPVCMYVADITMSIVKKGKRYSATAVITIMDTLGSPVPDATVYVSWGGVVSGTDSGLTGIDGKVTFVSRWSKSPGPYIIMVDNVTHPILVYCPEFNVETWDSITYGE